MSYNNRLYVLDVGFLDDAEAYDYWFQRMPDYRKDKISRFKPEASRKLSLGAGIVLYYAMEECGVGNAEIAFNEFEKPYIKSADGFEFNLSHSGTLAIGAFSGTRVGADVEKTQVFKKNLINYVYNDKEIKYIKYRSKNQIDNDNYFTKLWTVKESIMKYYGKGLSMNPKSILVDYEDGDKLYHEGKELNGIFIKSYKYKDYYVSVCSEYENFSDEIIELNGRLKK